MTAVSPAPCNRRRRVIRPARSAPGDTGAELAVSDRLIASRAILIRCKAEPGLADPDPGPISSPCFCCELMPVTSKPADPQTPLRQADEVILIEELRVSCRWEAPRGSALITKRQSSRSPPRSRSTESSRRGPAPRLPPRPGPAREQQPRRLCPSGDRGRSGRYRGRPLRDAADSREGRAGSQASRRVDCCGPAYADGGVRCGVSQLRLVRRGRLIARESGARRLWHRQRSAAKASSWTERRIHP